jgi:serine/threonine protein kinase
LYAWVEAEAMAIFHPQLGETLIIGGIGYGFMPHPLLGSPLEDVYAVDGGEALIYQLQELETGHLWALKVSKASFRGAHIARAAVALAPHVAAPGLYLARRHCLVRTSHPDLIARYPDLEYAVLMPWIIGRSWAWLLQDRAASARYTRRHALTLARIAAQVLAYLEAHGLAHTDIAGGNVLLAPDLSRVELLDLENLYSPHSPSPRRRRLGTPGYQHPRISRRGQWRPDGDRFAGAVLLTELLAWCDSTVREQTQQGAESLFQPHDLGEPAGPRWRMLHAALQGIWPTAAQLAERAAASRRLDGCPPLAEWHACLRRACEAEGISPPAQA